MTFGFAEEGLYRLANGHWLLVWCERDAMQLRYARYSPRRAAAWLMHSGHEVPWQLAAEAAALRLDLPNVADESCPPGAEEWDGPPPEVRPCPVEMQAEGGPVLVQGEPIKGRLTPGQHKALYRLRVIYPRRIDGPDLDAAIPNATRHLRAIRDKHPLLRKVLRFPGTRAGTTKGTGDGGYGIVCPTPAPSP
jgi:hypothetical protein